MTHWLVGSIEIIDKLNLLPSIIFWLIFIFFIIKYAPEIDLMSINTQLAMDRGINVKKIAKIIIILQAFSLGALIPFTGPIAFIGLIIPNVIRIFIHSSIKTLLYYTIIGGANFMLLAHFLSMRIKSGEIIPVGIITAVIGAIFLIISLASQIKAE
jgi:iron complex transport system permease protein